MRIRLIIDFADIRIFICLCGNINLQTYMYVIVNKLKHANKRMTAETYQSAGLFFFKFFILSINELKQVIKNYQLPIQIIDK